MSEQNRTLAEALASRRLLGFAAVQTVDAAPGPAGGTAGCQQQDRRR